MNWHRRDTLLLVILCGFSGGCSGGTEASARKHFGNEFTKWMSGQENEVSTMKSRIDNLLNPIGFDVRSVVQDKPDPLAFDNSHGLPESWKTWPAWRFNVAIEWKSRAGTPIEKVTTYTLTWNKPEQKWYVTERF